MNQTIKIFRNLAVTFSFIVLATVLGVLFQFWDFQPANTVLVYVFFVMLTSRFTKGYCYGLLATVLSFLLFNWFFTEPYYSLKINDPMYIITIIIMTVTATVTSALTSKVKQAATEAQEKEAESNALYQMTNNLTDAESAEKIASIAVRTVCSTLSCTAAFICCDEKGAFQPTFIQQKENGQQIHRELTDPNAFKKRVDNPHTPYEIGSEFFNFPIYGRTQLLAVLCLPREIGENLNKSQTRLLHSMMESVSLALDRFHSLEEQTRSHEETIRERYRGNLLRAISHDLRTPLSGIMGTSEMLMDMTEHDDPRYAMAKDIYEDADWLHGLVENILNLTKFQDGCFALHKQPEAVEEVIGAALLVMEKRAGEREFNVNIPDNLLLVPMDARLIAQVFVNLLDNAVKHTPADAEITICAEEDTAHGLARFSVADRGSGIPEDALPNIFKMFYTAGRKESSTQKGVGLGLSICQSIVEAHGGTITAQNRAGGGAEFVFTLPMEADTNEQT